ncbi:curli-like amyloid fiber formation chaperone CsgH [Erythrobacter sanguineus]|uniref:Curli assembly protein CsgC n=2 Tax=Erythrobacter sanguineus TaxID=198312 RepID=A0A1M7SL83_9SPHN|nr:curli-like amyloid fiber formation chaperone CsgH [Erythrobacter sanguineus]SHN59241.1 hypothetical protein SAMN02745193_01958 [Erythrobacter sanguineus]
MILPSCLAALLLPFASSTVPAMSDLPDALTLEVRQQGDTLEIQLIGDSPRTQQVSYLLEVTGQSSSRHRGKTTLAAHARTVLSTVRTTPGKSWCVRLLAEEEGREPYEILEGSCDAEG